MDPKQVLLQSNSWNDFTSNVSNLDLKTKGDCFEVLTQIYLLLSPKYSTKLKHVWLLKDVPLDIHSKLNLPMIDEGIDIIAESKESEFWAIQCKYRVDESHSLSRKELSTFTDLAFGICEKIKLALICTTTDRFSKKLTLYGDKISFCTGEVWRTLDSEFFNRVHDYIGGKVLSIVAKKPYQHQERAIKSASEHFIKNKNSRGKLIMPCGTGKSLTSYWIAHSLRSQSILIAVPSLALVRQTLDVWTAESIANNREINWICVCSDESVSNLDRSDNSVLMQDLGIRVHTDTAEITSWLNTQKSKQYVVITTYQSGKKIADAARESNTIFDVGILDEAHKTVGKRDSLFSHLLLDGNIQIKKRIFMTATERCFVGMKEQILSMDDANDYGHTFELLSFKEALEYSPPILSDYKIVTVLVSQNEISDLIGKKLYVKPDRGVWNTEVESLMLASAIALRKAIKSRPIKHVVSFHSSIAKAKAFKSTQDILTEALPEYGNLKTYHVSSKTSSALRSKQLTEFASSDRALITNARCLTEGVDVPNIDCVLFADPKRSTVDIVQSVGRALRPAKGKKLGYVIIPVLLDEDEIKDIESVTKSTYETVLSTLRALASNDERIIEYFREVSSKGSSIREPSPVENIIDTVSIDTDQFINSIELKFWSRLAKLSWRPFEQAKKFVNGLKLQSYKHWKSYCDGNIKSLPKKPDDIPVAPDQVYKVRGWANWGDWLGTQFLATREREYLPFKEAREFVHSLRLKSGTEWRSYCSGEIDTLLPKPDNIPAHADRTYAKEGWSGMGDWLGTMTVAPKDRDFLPFEEAREFVRSLGIKSLNEWYAYSKGELSSLGNRPDNIPAIPSRTYKDKGWVSYGDWFGTDEIATYKREYRTFEDARAFAQSLNLKSGTEWSMYCQGKISSLPPKPDDIPSNPQNTYKEKGWRGMGDWLGTNRVAPQFITYLTYDEARQFVRRLGLKGSSEWRDYCKGLLKNKGNKPDNIPAAPNAFYKDKDWLGYGDWLGTDVIATHLRQYRPFNEARKFARSLKLKSGTEWKKYCKGELGKLPSKPDDVPASPNRTYAKNGWKGMGDWLGTGIIATISRKYRPFNKARTFVHQLKLKNSVEWRLYCCGEMTHLPSKPEDIPANPQRTYAAKGWIGFRDWLGTKPVPKRKKIYRPFKDARGYVHTLKLKNVIEWRKYYKGELPEKGQKPDNIPAAPNVIYKNSGWKGFSDWLGTENVVFAKKKFRTFRKARDFVQSLGLKNVKEWRLYSRGELKGHSARPDDIPAAPEKIYMNDGWCGYGDWLGTNFTACSKRKYREFEEARKFARELKLSSAKEWVKYCKNELPSKEKKPDDIPANPQKTYKDNGWNGFIDWLWKS